MISDRDELIRIGLSKIPAHCRVAKSISIVLDSYTKGLSWQETREMVVKDSEDLGWFQAPANVAFVIIGWMYGEGDFGRSICIAASCGDDTDCTAATLGATLGIILGREKIPSQWTEPIGDRIITLAIDRGSINVPPTLSELTDQVMALAPVSLGAFGAPVEITSKDTDLSGLAQIDFTCDSVARDIWNRPAYGVAYDFVHTQVILDYGGDPDVVAGEAFPLKVTLKSATPDCRHMELIWHLPDDWNVSPGEAQPYYPLELGQRRVDCGSAPGNGLLFDCAGFPGDSCSGQTDSGIDPAHILQQALAGKFSLLRFAPDS